MAKQTYTKEERKAQFLKAGVALAKKDGIAKVSVAAVATKCNVTAPLVFHIFGNRDKLQAAIKREAKKQGVTLAEPKVAKKIPARKRSVAEVRAIKDKVAATADKNYRKVVKRATKVAPANAPKKVAAKKSPASASGAKASTSPRKKYAPNPVPQIAMPDEPKASL